MTMAPKDQFDIAGKTALITGGSKNIGKEIAKQLAEAGVTPLILYRDDTKAALSITESLAKKGVDSRAYKADLANSSALIKVTEKILKNHGGVDILINNAAIRPNAKIKDITIAEWDQVMATNLRAPFILIQQLLGPMIERKWGRIINIGGLDAYWGKPRRAHNVSAKMGLVGLTRAIANEVARFGITANIVVPGTTDTYRHSPEWYPELDKFYDERRQRIPMGRLGHANEVANACLFLASNLATYTTAQEFFVSGGAYPMVRQPSDEYPPEHY